MDNEEGPLSQSMLSSSGAAGAAGREQRNESMHSVRPPPSRSHVSGTGQHERTYISSQQQQPSHIRIGRDGSIRVNVGRRRSSQQSQRRKSDADRSASRAAAQQQPHQSVSERTLDSQHRKLANLQAQWATGGVNTTFNSTASFLSPNQSTRERTYSTISTRNTTLNSTDDSVRYIRERIERVNKGLESAVDAQNRSMYGNQLDYSYASSHRSTVAGNDYSMGKPLQQSFHQSSVSSFVSGGDVSSVQNLSERSQKLLQATRVSSNLYVLRLCPLKT